MKCAGCGARLWILFRSPCRSFRSYLNFPRFDLPITPYFRSNNPYSLLYIPSALPGVIEPCVNHTFSSSPWFNLLPSCKILNGPFITFRGHFTLNYPHLLDAFLPQKWPWPLLNGYLISLKVASGQYLQLWSDIFCILHLFLFLNLLNYNFPICLLSLHLNQLFLHNWRNIVLVPEYTHSSTQTLVVHL